MMMELRDEIKTLYSGDVMEDDEIKINRIINDHMIKREEYAVAMASITPKSLYAFVFMQRFFCLVGCFSPISNAIHIDNQEKKDIYQEYKDKMLCYKLEDYLISDSKFIIYYAIKHKSMS